MNEQPKNQQGNLSPIASMLQSQGAMSSGNKFTNVFMPNQQQASLEYLSEATIPKEIQTAFPLEYMMINKRALGNEQPEESAMNDNNFDWVSLLNEMGYGKQAVTQSLSYLNHREGGRTKGGFERDHQVMQKTLSHEELVTIQKMQKKGFWPKFNRFAEGGSEQGTVQ